jgi:hypothetical protein
MSDHLAGAALEIRGLHCLGDTTARGGIERLAGPQKFAALGRHNRHNVAARRRSQNGCP